MPLKRTVSEREPQPPQEQEEAIPEAKRPRLEPDEDQAVEPGRPYRAFVERGARKYWEEIEKRDRNLAKPSQTEIRAAAILVLCLALRNRRGSRRHQAVVSMVQHALERDWMVQSIHDTTRKISTQLKREPGWIKRPVSEAHESPSYIDALIQLADDAMWLAKEITLPDHPPPYHPRIYYTMRIKQGYPTGIPREDAVIRGDYVYENRESRSRVIKDGDFYPMMANPRSYWRDHKIREGGRAYYTVWFKYVKGQGDLDLTDMWLHWKEKPGRGDFCYAHRSISEFRFSPPSMEPGRPYQTFVESEARKYWLDIEMRDRNLAKPSQKEIRAAAMPVLCLALRNRRGSRRHQAVACMVQHALERDWITRSFSEASESPSYIDALIQLADDAM